MNIRPMLAQDVPVIAHWMIELPLWQRYGVTEVGASAQFGEALEHTNDLLLVAEAKSDGFACGFAQCLHGGAFGRSDYLRLIGVCADYVGEGIGAALLTEVEAQSRSSDLFLLTSDFNEGAQRFYRRMGYEQVGAIPGYVVPDVTELIFRKRLH